MAHHIGPADDIGRAMRIQDFPGDLGIEELFDDVHTIFFCHGGYIRRGLDSQMIYASFENVLQHDAVVASELHHKRRRPGRHRIGDGICHLCKMDRHRYGCGRVEGIVFIEHHFRINAVFKLHHKTNRTKPN